MLENSLALVGFECAALVFLGLLGRRTERPAHHGRIERFLSEDGGDRFQVEAALNSFTSGGWLGRGPGEGTFKRILPDAHTDFIFAVTAEEFGIAICLFIGLILGTLPSLWAEAGAQGRGRGAYLSCAASFLALSAVLLYAQYGAFYTMRPGFLGFLFCGLLWGLSLIVPGMTSSSILMAVGLFTPMAEGFARLDMAVILPWLLGMALIVLTLARVVNWCFQTHYPLFYHAVFGIVLASTVVIIPLHYDGARDALLCLLAAALGALAAYLSAKLQPKEDA